MTDDYTPPAADWRRATDAERDLVQGAGPNEVCLDINGTIIKTSRAVYLDAIKDALGAAARGVLARGVDLMDPACELTVRWAPGLDSLTMFAVDGDHTAECTVPIADVRMAS